MSSSLIAQVPDIALQGLLDPRNSARTPDQVMNELQALFIQEVFVKPLLKEPDMIDYEEDSIFSTSQSTDMSQIMYAREISRILAEQDLLGMQRYLE